MKRSAQYERNSNETTIQAQVTLDGSGEAAITCPIGFFTHMLESFAKHGLFDLTLRAEGDLHVDQHHLIEDCGIVLGKVFREALGDKKGINRAGYFVYPMDEALAVVAIDIGGRSYLQYEVQFTRQFCGEMEADLLYDFFYAFSQHLGANIAVRMPYGRSDHHKMEAIFKAFAKSMKMACSMDPRAKGNLPTTKGIFDDRDS